MSPEERESIKAELREEIMNELSNKQRKRPSGLETVYKRWFYGPDSRDKYKNSKMAQAFGNATQWKVWEAVRTLARLVLGKSRVAQLDEADQEAVERVTEAICQLVYSLKSENVDLKERRCEKINVSQTSPGTRH